MWGLKTTKIYSFTILEARSPNSRCQESHAPSDGLGQGALFPFPFRGSRRSLVRGHRTPISASSFTWPSRPCISLFQTSLFFLFYRHLSLYLGPTLNSACSHQEIFNLITSAKHLFPNSQGLGLRFGSIFWGETQFSLYLIFFLDKELIIIIANIYWELIEASG